MIAPGLDSGAFSPRKRAWTPGLLVGLIVGLFLGLLPGLLIGATLGTAGEGPCKPQESTPGSDYLHRRLSYGERFERPFGQGWRLILEPVEHGWWLSVLDSDDRDLSAWTPPFRSSPHPREIAGWHFRSVDNAGPNDGSVNAPQRVRDVFFSPAPWPAAGQPELLEVEEAIEFGHLPFEIVDFGLAGLERGERARMVWLEFEACPAWDPDGWVGAVAREIRERLETCGLAAELRPTSRLFPSILEADFDGDGTRDLAAFVRRQRDGKHGVAVCLGGVSLDLVALDSEIGELHPDYLERITWWGTIEPLSSAPESAAASILLGKEGASSVEVYRERGEWKSRWRGD